MVTLQRTWSLKPLCNIVAAGDDQEVCFGRTWLLGMVPIRVELLGKCPSESFHVLQNTQ